MSTEDIGTGSDRRSRGVIEELIKQFEDVAEYDAYTEEQVEVAQTREQIAGWLREFVERDKRGEMYKI